MSASTSVDVLIAGAGVAGASLAYYLTELGNTDLLIVDHDEAGSGQTRWSFGGVRQQFSTRLEIELAKRGLRFWKSAEEALESPCPFSQSGYLFVTSNPERFELMKQASALQRELGCPDVHALDPSEISEVVPWMTTDDLVGGTWTPNDGHVTATDGIAGMMKRVRRAGGALKQRAGVVQAERSGSGWRIRLADGSEVRANQYVVAAGLRSDSLLAEVGHTIALQESVLRYAITEPALQDVSVPVTIDFDTGMVLEREGNGLAISVMKPEGSGSEIEMLEEFADIAEVRAPVLTQVGIRQGITAPIDLSADGHAYVGAVDDGLWTICGFSGHGVMHGPSTAEQLALMMTGKPTEVDLTALDPLRIPQDSEGEWMIAMRRD